MSDNLIQAISIESEDSCKSECHSEERCGFYTYHSSASSYFPNTCFLMTMLEEPIKSCSSCQTGAIACTGTAECHLMTAQRNSTVPALIFTDWQAEDITVIALGSCSLTVVVVGGGAGSYSSGSGGGSGYVAWEKFPVQSSLFTMDVTVGGGGRENDRGETSRVRGQFNEEHDFLVEASGGKADNFDGGDGYCGGGSDGYYGAGGNGGSDGRNGRDGHDTIYEGGQGSGMKVSNITLNYHLLSPGNGGQGTGSSSNSKGRGGGGGGVLVDDQGQQGQLGGGQGFGAGAGDGEGTPGLVIIEYNI